MLSINRKKKSILKSFKLLKTKKDFIFPLLAFPEPIEQALKLFSDNKLKYLLPKDSKKNTQFFSKKYYDSGQFYTSTVYGWKSQKKTLKGFVLPKYSTVDIDDIEDWNFAKYLFLKKMKKIKKNRTGFKTIDPLPNKEKLEKYYRDKYFIKNKNYNYILSNKEKDFIKFISMAKIFMVKKYLKDLKNKKISMLVRDKELFYIV